MRFPRASILLHGILELYVGLAEFCLLKISDSPIEMVLVTLFSDKRAGCRQQQQERQKKQGAEMACRCVHNGCHFPGFMYPNRNLGTDLRKSPTL